MITLTFMDIVYLFLGVGSVPKISINRNFYIAGVLPVYFF